MVNTSGMLGMKNLIHVLLILLQICIFHLLTSSYSFYARTSPSDVARVERQTYVCTENKADTVPTPKEGIVSSLGNWKSVAQMDSELNSKFTGCMKGNEVVMWMCEFCEFCFAFFN